MLANMYSQLELEDIGLDVKLGYSEKERSVSQRILVQIIFRFEEIPSVCVTDHLQDTLCYATLVDELQRFCNNHSFKLIEALGYQLYQFIKKKLSLTHLKSTAVFLRVIKNPPLSALKQAIFSISD